MKGIAGERAVELGGYIIENQTAVRAAARKFGIGKSKGAEILDFQTKHGGRKKNLPAAASIFEPFYCFRRQVRTTDSWLDVLPSIGYFYKRYDRLVP